MSAPDQLSVYGVNGELLVRYIKSVRYRVLRDNLRVTLDFSRVRRVAPHGAILLYAELDRIVSCSDQPKPMKIIPPLDNRCRQVFKQVGLLGLTSDDVAIQPDRDDVAYWRCTAGTDQSGDGAGNLLERVADKANKFARRKLILRDIWPGVSEAIINTTDHAYALTQPPFPPRHPERRWWLLTLVKEDVFAAVVCDLGVGYRKTTPITIGEWISSNTLKLLANKNRDANAIELAMEYGRSRTKLENRGKGSRDALSVLTQHKNGELVIISNSGCVHYEFDKDSQELRVHKQSLKVDINATIVWWRLPLNGGVN
ncbi:hypothetical protein [Alcaligenes nematophilus]|uniref:hypothetical protein n=1 Tax=Alcaligenes nematophilus TaxID=2994643 RepID=UPI00384F529A